MGNKERSLKAVLLVLLPLSLGTIGASVVKPDIVIKYIKAYPYTPGENGRIDVHFVRNVAGYKTVVVKTAKDRELVYQIAQMYTETKDTKDVIYTFSVRASMMYEAETYTYVYMPLNLYDETGRGLEFIWRPSRKQTIYVNNESNKYIKYINAIFYDGSSLEEDEIFDFIGFDTLLYDEYYYRINLNRIYFEYICPLNSNTLNTSSIVLKISDPEYKYFPYIHDRLDGQVMFPLSIKRKDEKTYNFQLAGNYYVDPSSLMMFTYPSQGTVLSSYLYLPKNAFEGNLDLDMEITINDAGLNNFDFIYRFEYVASHELLGDCSTSAYCVKGENSWADFSRGHIGGYNL